MGTVHLVALAWVFFLADSFGQAGDSFAGLLRFPDETAGGDTGLLADLALAGGLLVAMFCLDWVDRSRATMRPLQRWGAVRLGVPIGVMLVALIVWSGGATEPCIHFQF